jgi:hypothetical protein
LPSELQHEKAESVGTDQVHTTLILPPIEENGDRNNACSGVSQAHVVVDAGEKDEVPSQGDVGDAKFIASISAKPLGGLESATSEKAPGSELAQGPRAEWNRTLSCPSLGCREPVAVGVVNIIGSPQPQSWTGSSALGSGQVGVAVLCNAATNSRAVTPSPEKVLIARLSPGRMARECAATAESPAGCFRVGARVSPHATALHPSGYPGNPGSPAVSSAPVPTQASLPTQAPAMMAMATQAASASPASAGGRPCCAASVRSPSGSRSPQMEQRVPDLRAMPVVSLPVPPMSPASPSNARFAFYANAMPTAASLPPPPVWSPGPVGRTPLSSRSTTPVPAARTNPFPLSRRKPEKHSLL